MDIYGCTKEPPTYCEDRVGGELRVVKLPPREDHKQEEW